MDTPELSALDDWRSSELRIVLLGGRNSGKSSLGNLILGREEFVTRERTSCSWRVGLVTRRWLTVVDTPGWWCDFSSRDTAKLVRREIVGSVSLCSPGPHVFLIAVKASSAFSEKRRRALEEHVALLGERAWGHCIVVFTSAGRTEQEEAGWRGEGGTAAFCWLSEKCAQRVHSVSLSNGGGVPQLIEKIKRLVMENGNQVFEMEESLLLATVEDKRAVEERALRRLTGMKKRRSLMREKLQPITHLRIVLLGAKGSGKTSCLNTILDRVSVLGPGRTAQCWAAEGLVFGRQVTVVDTPGWWMNYFCDESSAFDRREIWSGSGFCPPGPHAFLLVVRVDRAFTETYRRAAQEHLQLISENIWNRVIVVFSCGDWLGDSSPELYIESEGEPLRWLVDRCANRYHVLNNKTKGDGYQVRDLIGKIEEMVAGVEGSLYFEMDRAAFEQLDGMKARERKRAEERLERKNRQRQMARSQLGKVDHLQQLTVILVGGGKSGQSSCANTILNGTSFENHTMSRTKKKGKVVLTVLDTSDRFHLTSDLLTAPPAGVVLLVVNLSSSFKDAQMQVLESRLQAAGRPAWSRALVLFSFGDWLGDTSVEQRIESEGEVLRGLVERCGNRYHVLDNEQRRGGTQVDELMDLIEEMLLGGERPPGSCTADHMTGGVSAAGGKHGDKAMACRNGSTVFPNLGHRLSYHSESTPLCSCPALSCSGVPGDDGLVASCPAGGRSGPDSKEDFTPILAASLSGKGRPWSSAADPRRSLMNLPVWLNPGDPFSGWRLSPQNPVWLLPCQSVVLFLPPARDTPIEDNFRCSPSSPAQGERSADLLEPTCQQGDYSLRQLEAFIDRYFEVLMGQETEPCEPAEPDPPDDTGADGTRVLLSIDKKLSKLSVLEEIRSDLTELRRNLERNSRAEVEDLLNRMNDNNTC